MFSQVTEHGRERYSFDPRNKERGEGRRARNGGGGVRQGRGGTGETDRWLWAGGGQTDRQEGGAGRETAGYRIRPHEKAALLKGV